jgi:uncharacterized protein (DUF1015 family)
MVRVYPFNSLISASASCQLSNTDSRDVPHSLSYRKPHSRSVANDQHCNDICLKAGAGVQHEVETDLLRQTPFVVISRMSNKATEGSSNSPCNEHGINYQNVDDFIDGGILELVKERSFLIYSQETRGNHRQVGICAALAVEDCLKGTIKRHENVIMEAQSLKKAHQIPLSRNVDPVMIMYKRSDKIQSIIDRITTSRCPVIAHSRSRRDIPLGVLNDNLSAAHINDNDNDNDDDNDNDKHEIWSVTDEEDIEAIRIAFLQVESLYIADGHHRTAAACRISQQDSDNAGYRKASHTK